ncbi:unnamed protein product, partial [Rotaria sordida]
MKARQKWDLLVLN